MKLNKTLTSFFSAIVFTFALNAQSTNGIITDLEDVPLPGATIVNMTTSEGVTSDFDGKFSIEASDDDILSISYIGYSTVEVSISADNQNLNIKLEPEDLD
jgi:hypothetical protein